MSDANHDALRLREKLVHIDQTERARANALRKRQEIRWHAIVLIFAGMTAGAALFATAAFVNLLGG
jgi:hypothetical protein